MTSPIRLRALEMEDLPRTRKWHNDPEVYNALTGAFRHVSAFAEEEWLRKRVAYSNAEVNLAICLAETGEHIGNVYIREIDWVSRCAECKGLLIGDPSNRAKGYGPVAMRLTIKHAFQDLGLRRLVGYIVAENRQSIRMLEKSGWVQEGILRRHYFKHGKNVDAVVMGVCVEDVEGLDWYEETGG